MGLILLAGPANVIMQLGRPAVGCAVMESRVESGRVDRHPIKRARTTFTYLAVANHGSPAQKAAFRHAVDRAHAQVYSTEDSPVKYNAFDPQLQLWVAALPTRAASTPTGRSSARWTTNPPTGITGNASGWRRHCRSPGTCGLPIDRRSRSTGRNRSRRCISTTRCAHSCTRSRRSALGDCVCHGHWSNLFEDFALLMTTELSAATSPRPMRLPWVSKAAEAIRPIHRIVADGQQCPARLRAAVPFNVLLHDLD